MSQNRRKNTIGFWTKQEDWVSWQIEIKQPGEYTAMVLQGCGKGSGGSEVRFLRGKCFATQTAHSKTCRLAEKTDRQ